MVAFVAGAGTADYKKSDAVAEMAIKWAQERREKVEVSSRGRHLIPTQ